MNDEPDSTAVRTALWRALHVEKDAPPHVFDDTLGLALAAPPAAWQARPDMAPPWTAPIRAGIVQRARFVEDLLAERTSAQYVILGAGLDTFVQRRPELASTMHVYEVDQPGPQRWKQRRIAELGWAAPVFVPVDFEAGASWWDELVAAGFDTTRPAFVTSLGVSMYLTRDAIAAMLRQVAALAPGSTFVLTFLVPGELLPPDERAGLEAATRGAQASGTPFVSFFTPDAMVALARECGFSSVEHVAPATLRARYFAGRIDGLAPGSGEQIVVCTSQR
jgi:methyltransferase (TIGR00027 family)